MAERIAGSSSRVIQIEDNGTESISLAQKVVHKETAILETETLAAETLDSMSPQLTSDDRYATLLSYPKNQMIESNNNSSRSSRKENPYLYVIGVTGYFQRLRELWVNRRCRRALLSAGVAMISQQMTGKYRSCMVKYVLRTTGVNTIAFLGTAVWQNSLGPAAPAKVSAIIGLVFGISNYLGGLPVSQVFICLYLSYTKQSTGILVGRSRRKIDPTSNWLAKHGLVHAGLCHAFPDSGGIFRTGSSGQRICCHFHTLLLADGCEFSTSITLEQE